MHLLSNAVKLSITIGQVTCLAIWGVKGHLEMLRLADLEGPAGGLLWLPFVGGVRGRGSGLGVEIACVWLPVTVGSW